MQVKTRFACLLIVVLVPLLIISCGKDEGTATPEPGVQFATPDIQATIAALARAEEFQTPTPTPVSPQQREVALDFVKSHTDITRNWEKFHVTFDEWRAGLVACDASAMEGTLRDFAGSFRALTEVGRMLPRSPGLTGLVDVLVSALETEEKAIRTLRDTWDPADVSPFEEVDIARSAALALQKEVQDRLNELQNQTELESQSRIANYSLAVRQLSSEWNKFHRDYDTFRTQEAGLTFSETVLRVSQLISQFRSIVSGIRILPTTDLTRPVSNVLAVAAEEEDLALRKLRNSFQKLEIPSDGGAGADGSTVTFTPPDTTLFDVFDAQLVKSDTLRRQAEQQLAFVLELTSQDSQTAVDEFTQRYDTLIQSWDAFHSNYDNWRRAEGGCDRARAIATLASFTIRFERDIASPVRELPRASFLRPLGELLVEAAEREEQGLRTLRNIWRPFDADIYVAFDGERNEVGKLRRQVATGIQDVLVSYEISVTDIAR